MMRWRLLLIAAGMLPAVAGLGAETQKTAQLLESFHVATDGDPLLVPVSVWGERQLFMLDTGFTCTCFDDSARKNLGSQVDKVRVHAARGSLLTAGYRAPAMMLGKIPLACAGLVVCCNMAAIRKMTGTDEAGILGIDSLRPLVVQADFDRGEVSFFAAGTSDPSWGDPIPLGFDKRGSPEVNIAVCGVARLFMIDTGAKGITIDHQLRAELAHAGKLRPLHATGYVDLLGTHETATYAAEHTKLGRFEHCNLHVDDGQKNIVGLRYLARFCVTFDFPRGILYLRRGARYAEPDNGNESLIGFDVAKVAGQVRVNWVEDDSPATAAGIETGDQISRVNGRDATSYGLLELRRLFASRKGRKIVLTTVRSGKSREVELILRAPTPPDSQADEGPVSKTD